jgi:hypothetical protein
MRRWYLSLAGVIACTVLLLGPDVVTAQEDNPLKPSENSEQQSPSPDEQEAGQGYPVRKRQIGGPTDVEWDLDNSFPKRGSVLELILRCPDSQEQ